jgi:DNA-binding GntR family transcriptional regulator
VEDVKQIRELREILELGAIRLAYEKSPLPRLINWKKYAITFP